MFVFEQVQKQASRVLPGCHPGLVNLVVIDGSLIDATISIQWDTVTGLVLAGTDSGNYVLKDKTVTITADIVLKKMDWTRQTTLLNFSQIGGVGF